MDAGGDPLLAQRVRDLVPCLGQQDEQVSRMRRPLRGRLPGEAGVGEQPLIARGDRLPRLRPRSQMLKLRAEHGGLELRQPCVRADEAVLVLVDAAVVA